MNLSLRSISKVLYACIIILVISSQAVAIESKININTADVQQLTQLQRIGASYAKRIIAYREQNGDFSSPEGIMKVKGIGKKTFEINKSVIIVSDKEPTK